ncbi:MAG: cytoplasmic protein [Chloroflexi bacterium]|nr:cytoplasmic protein [Chloroflexota bacterium]MCI0827280.1 cytoplasmic protein [Chloroflexota bacterium]MCI0892076.1 cytoplasmic protein [Chloroflexota bacterium]
MQENSSLDPVALDPDKFEVRLENDRVRVLEARIAPGQGHGMHWHPPHLIYTLSPVQDTFTGGSTKTMERGAGELLWGEELTHATQNVGETGVHALIIEFKG